MKTLVLFAAMAAVFTAGPVRAQAPGTPETTRLFLSAQCESCHNDRTVAPRNYAAPRQFNVGALDIANVQRDTAVWENVLVRLRTGTMPPAPSRQPQAEINAAVRFIEGEIDKNAPSHITKIPPHRVNSREYRPLVYDLLGISFEPREFLPLDESTHGFDNIASALGWSADIEKAYRTAAEALSQRAVIDGKKVFICTPKSSSAEPGCARAILENLTANAYRGYATAGDVDELVRLTQVAPSWQDFDQKIATAIAAILQNRKFLYRTETEPSDAKPGTSYRISDLDLASRLSFFIWSSGPDRELLDFAKAGRLKDSDVLAVQVQRMLKDPRSDAMARNLADQWLCGSCVSGASPRTSLFPDFDSSLRDAMRLEVELVFRSIVREDRSITDLIDADYTYLNGRLAQHYGVPGVNGAEFQRVTLNSTFDARRGILGKGAFLATTSRSERTSPTFRGRWALYSLLGVQPPDPAPNDPPIPPVDPTRPQPTTRQRLETHTLDTRCSTCHRMTDSVGLALENFDPVGSWRTNDGDFPVNSVVTLYDGTKVNGPADLRGWLLARSDQFVQVAAERMLTYALGRGLQYQDMPVVRSVARGAAGDNNRFSTIVREIVTSDAFRMNAK
jgi:Protein of unknown function (DUF1592)/Protein of unknown function (DUF1588)/Protein of unknown function (DUF1585)/Protein of unknown function (DUF1587)/Protein of unknown function (DUF1595)